MRALPGAGAAPSMSPGCRRRHHHRHWPQCRPQHPACLHCHHCYARQCERVDCDVGSRPCWPPCAAPPPGRDRGPRRHWRTSRRKRRSHGLGTPRPAWTDCLCCPCGTRPPAHGRPLCVGPPQAWTHRSLPGAGRQARRRGGGETPRAPTQGPRHPQRPHLHGMQGSLHPPQPCPPPHCQGATGPWASESRHGPLAPASFPCQYACHSLSEILSFPLREGPLTCQSARGKGWTLWSHQGTSPR